jgi:hypothetical protein
VQPPSPTARWLAVASLGIAAAAAAQNVAPAPENTGPNASIVRWASGQYVYRTIREQRARGTEDWHLDVHPDGTRTLVTFNDLFARNNQATVVLRVRADFRPIEAYTTYWNGGRYKGSALFRFDGNLLRGAVSGANGLIEQQLAVPENVSIATHPLAGDGWHTWYYDAARGGRQAGKLVNVDASADVSAGPVAKIQDSTWELVGREKITVPAGEFQVRHFTSGQSEIWVMDQDSMLVKFSWPSLDTEYLLASYRSGTGAPPAGETPRRTIPKETR